MNWALICHSSVPLQAWFPNSPISIGIGADKNLQHVDGGAHRQQHFGNATFNFFIVNRIDGLETH